MKKRGFRRGKDCPHCGRRAEHPLRDDEMCKKCATVNVEKLRTRLAPGIEGPESYRQARED